MSSEAVRTSADLSRGPSRRSTPRPLHQRPWNHGSLPSKSATQSQRPVSPWHFLTLLTLSFVTVCGDGEYIIYTSLAWRNKAFGTGTSFAWATDSNTYAVQEGKSRVRVYRNFKERAGLIKSTGGWAVEGVHGGALLSARGNGFVMFWDWETGAVVRRIEVDATNVSTC